MSDLTESIAELRRVTPSNAPWDGSDFNGIPAPIDDAICVILNAVLSGELVILTALEAERAKVARLARVLDAARAVNHDSLHGNGLEGFRKNRDRLRIALEQLETDHE